MTEVENFIKSGIILLMGVAVLSGLLSTELAQTFSGLGTFLIIMAIIIAILSFLIPLLRRIF